MLDILIPVFFLAGAFTAGFLVCHFTKEYRAKAMFYLYGKATQDYPCQERLEEIYRAWSNMRTMFYTYRGGLQPYEYFALVTLMARLDELLSFDERRETEPIVEENNN